jgi:hypothetical protein
MGKARLDRFTLEYQGREYTVERGQPRADASMRGGAPAGPNRWYVTLGPKAITSIDEIPHETEATLRARIVDWLAAHPQMPKDEDIVLGGG